MSNIFYYFIEGEGTVIYPILEKRMKGFREKVKDYATFTKIVSADPTSKVTPEGEVKFVGNYSKWLIQQFINGQFKLEDSYKALEYLTAFKRHYTKLADVKLRNINNYKTLADVYDVLDQNNLLQRETKGELRQKVHAAEKDIDFIYEDDKWQVVSPNSYEASCNWGADTQWCTATRSSDSWYKQYTEQGPLYILVNKNNPKEKYQFHVQSGQYMDSKDHSIDIIAFFHKNPALSKAFFHIVTKTLELNKKPEEGVAITATHDTITIVIDGIEPFAQKFTAGGSDRNADYATGQWIYEFLNGERAFKYNKTFKPNLSDAWVWKNIDHDNVARLKATSGIDESSTEALMSKIQETNKSLTSKIQKAALKAAAEGSAEKCRSEIEKAIERSGFTKTTDGRWTTTISDTPGLLALGEGGWSGLFKQNRGDKALYPLYLLERTTEGEELFAGFDVKMFNDDIQKSVEEKTKGEEVGEPEEKEGEIALEPAVGEPVKPAVTKKARKKKTVTSGEPAMVEEESASASQIFSTYLDQVAHKNI